MHTTMLSKIFNFPAQFITNILVLNKQNTLTQRLMYKTLLKIRDLTLSHYDPIIEYNLDGLKILLPFSHNLPLYLSIYEEYARNLIQLVTVLSANINNLKLIDVGANIGDTVLLVRKNFEVPVLAIEPEARYFDLLVKNTSVFNRIKCEQVYLGDKNKLLNMRLDVKDGTAYLKKTTTKKNRSHIRKLDTLLEKNIEFSDAKLLIIDTDGYDFLILKGSRRYLKEVKPVVFFEYDPNALNKYGKNSGINLIKYLVSLGYEKAIFYDNFGKYLLSTDLFNENLINNLHNYVLGNRRLYFYDVCAFHKKDHSLYKKVEESGINTA